jgi:YcxB-like protein
MDDLTAASPGQATRFEVSTRLDTRDYLQLIRVVRWNVTEQILAAFTAAGPIFIGALLTSNAMEMLVGPLSTNPFGNWTWAWSWAPMGGALIAFFLYRLFYIGPYLSSTFYGQPIGMGETTIVADINGVSATSAEVAIVVPWKKVQDVIDGKDHLFLMFCRLTGLIVPRRAFTDEREAKRFAEFVRHMTHKPTSRNGDASRTS